MSISGLIIDLDGVLTKSKDLEPFEDTIEFIEFLKERGIPFVIATNNSLFSPEELVYKMKEKGINININEIITPLRIIPDYLKRKKISEIYVIGSSNLIAFFKGLGFKVKNSYFVQAIIIGQDKEFNFEKIKIATTAVKENDAEILALNGNLITKDDDGLLFTGVGSVANMFAYATKKSWTHFGKNSPEYNKKLLSNFKDLNNLAIISDDLFTDLKPFKKLGLKTVFITTGKYKKADIPKDWKPDIVVSSLTDFLRILK